MNSKAKVLAVWWLPVTLFYVCWFFWLVPDWGFDQLMSHWPIAAAMAIGSFFAGSTPMGGGTVGFPVLVLGFDLPTQLGRDFSLAVQSIGMVSASLMIFAREIPLATYLIRGAVVGSLLGVPLGLLYVEPQLNATLIKLSFATLWAAFGVLHLRYAREFAERDDAVRRHSIRDEGRGLIIGLLAGSTTVAVTGVGIDMVLYTVLLLWHRVDLRVAIPSSVVIMAFCSVYGSVWLSVLGLWSDGVYAQWIAAAPVVALGAPLGVWVAHRIPRYRILIVVALLCVGQWFWAVFDQWAVLTRPGLVFSFVGLALAIILLETLHHLGKRRAQSRRQQ